MLFDMLPPIDLQRRSLELEERKYLLGRGAVTETQSNMGEEHYCMSSNKGLGVYFFYDTFDPVLK